MSSIFNQQEEPLPSPPAAGSHHCRSATAPTCPAETHTRTPEPSSSSSSAEQRSAHPCPKSHSAELMAASWHKNLTLFLLFFFFPSPDDDAFAAAAGGARTHAQVWPLHPNGCRTSLRSHQPTRAPCSAPWLLGTHRCHRDTDGFTFWGAPHPLRLTAKGQGIYSIKYHVSLGGMKIDLDIQSQIFSLSFSFQLCFLSLP